MPEPLIVCRPYCLEKLSGFLRRKEQDFPGGPVVKSLVKAMQGVWVQSLVRELDPTSCN